MATIEELEREVKELRERLACFEAKTGFMSAETMKANAEAWIERNPRAWDFIVNRANSAVKEQKRFSIKRTLEDFRDLPEFVWWGDDDFKISNSYSPVFARILVKQVPGLEEFVTLKRSKVDRLFR